MEGLFKQLTKYGVVLVRQYNTYWSCYCEVKLFEHDDKKEVAKVTGPKLYETLRELLKQSAITKKRLLDKAREPKQEKLNYGSENKEWSEIA